MISILTHFVFAHAQIRRRTLCQVLVFQMIRGFARNHPTYFRWPENEQVSLWHLGKAGSMQRGVDATERGALSHHGRVRASQAGGTLAGNRESIEDRNPKKRRRGVNRGEVYSQAREVVRQGSSSGLRRTQPDSDRVLHREPDEP